MQRIVREHQFFAGLGDGFFTLVTNCSRNERFESGQYLFHAGEPADEFYLLRSGRIALGVNAPGRGTILLQTLTADDIVGVSWLIPPYRWAYDARAVEL